MIIICETIAMTMYKILKESNRKTVWYGDVDIIEDCAKKSGVLKKHPKSTIQAVLNSLDKSPLFIKGYIRADFNGYMRKYRTFTIKF